MENQSDEEHGSGSQQQEQVFIIPSEASIKSVQSATVKLPPTPDNSKVLERWRKCSRFVVYADMLITFVGFIQCGLLMVMISWIIHLIRRYEGYQGIQITESMVLSLSIFQLGCHIRGFWMAHELYLATSPVTAVDSWGAVERLIRWRCFQTLKIVVALIIGILTSINGLSFGSLNFVWLGLRLALVCIVHKLIYEVDKSNEAAELRTMRSADSLRPLMTFGSNKTVPTPPPSARSQA